MFVAGPELFGRADPHVHAELGAHQQQRVGHVVAAVPDERESDVGQRLRAVLGHGEDIGEHLRGMELVGESVEHRHPGVLRQLLDDLLAGAAVLDRVVHPAEHPRGVLHRLLVPDLRRVGVDVGHVGTLVVRRHLERATGTRGGLLEDERDVLARQAGPAEAGVLRPLEIPGQIEQVEQVAIGVMDQAEQTAVAIVERHGGFSFGGRDQV